MTTHFAENFHTRDSSETLKLLKPILLEEFGITRIGNIGHFDEYIIPVSLAIRPNAKSTSVAEGNGLTESQAQLSAVLKSIASWHAENMPSPTLFGSYLDLHSKYHSYPLHQITQSFISYRNLEEHQLPWVSVENLLQDDKSHIVPYALLSLDKTTSYGSELFLMKPYGLAAGLTREAAICHAILALIEHDCRLEYMNLSAEKQRLRQIKPEDSLGNQMLIECLQQYNLELTISDIANRFQIPCFAVMITDKRNVKSWKYYLGYGADLSPECALTQAILEASQNRLLANVGLCETSFYSVEKKLYKKIETEKCHLYQSSCEKISYKNFTEYQKILFEKLQQEKITQILMYDHSRSSIGVSVVHIIIPQLHVDWQLRQRGNSFGQLHSEILRKG